MSDNFTSRVDVYKRAAENKSLESLVEIARLIYSTLENKGTVFAAGNGGSAAEASHFVAELVGRFIPSDRKSLRAVSLNSDMPSITAIGNDYGFQEIFSRQLSVLATPGDIVICFSTSGTSENILRLIETARELRVKVVLFTGEKLNKILPSCNVIFNVESSITALIQEVHLSAIHMLCSYLEEAYAGKSGLNDEPKILQLYGLETSPSIREEIVWVNGCFDLLHK
jgi:D-sedoheptulose 7-phosphate isomerase